MKCFLYLFFLSLHCFILAQNKISGYLYLENQEAAPFIPVALLHNNTILAYTESNEKGFFTIQHAFETGKKYGITIQHTTFTMDTLYFIYPDTTNLKKITLKMKTHQLNTVQITAKQPVIIHKPGKNVIVIENTTEAINNDALQILKRMPQVRVEQDKIFLQDVPAKIMINNVLLNMEGTSLITYLQTIRSENIYKIELIKKPGAKYDAEGTGKIIHLILKKRVDYGLATSVYAQTEQRYKPRSGMYRAGINADYGYKNFQLYGHANSTTDTSKFTYTSTFTYPGQEYTVQKDTNHYAKKLWNGKLGMSYTLQKRHKIILESDYSPEHQNNYSTGYLQQNFAFTAKGNSYAHTTVRNTQNIHTLNYTLDLDTTGSNIQVIGMYNEYKNRSYQDYNNVFDVSTENFFRRTSQIKNRSNARLQANFTHVLDTVRTLKWGLSAYQKNNFNHNFQDVLQSSIWIQDTLSTNSIGFFQQVAAVYGEYTTAFKKLDIEAGLRTEYAVFTGKNYTNSNIFSKTFLNLFPSLSLNYTTNQEDGNGYYLDFERNVIRPDFYQLNPVQIRRSRYTYEKGNLNLNPNTDYYFAVARYWADEYTVEFYGTFGQNDIGTAYNPISSYEIETSYINLKNNYSLGLWSNIPFEINENFKGYFSGSAGYLQTNAQNTQLSTWNFHISISYSYRINPKHSLSGFGYYYPRTLYANTLNRTYFYHEISYNVQILKHFNMRLSYHYQHNFSGLTTLNNTSRDYTNQPQNHSINLNIQYVFRKGKSFKRNRAVIPTEEGKKSKK